MDYWYMAAILVIAWVFHLILGVKPRKLTSWEWAEHKNVLVKQANELFYLLLALPLCWVGHNIYVLGHQLIFIVWIVRIYAGYICVTRLFGVLVGIFHIFEPYSLRLILSHILLAFPTFFICLLA